MRYKEGATIYLEVSNAEQSLLNAELDYVTAQSQLFQSYANLYKAMGGGGSPQRKRSFPAVSCRIHGAETGRTFHRGGARRALTRPRGAIPQPADSRRDPLSREAAPPGLRAMRSGTAARKGNNRAVRHSSTTCRPEPAPALVRRVGPAPPLRRCVHGSGYGYTGAG